MSELLETDAAQIHVKIMVNGLLRVTDINVIVNLDSPAANVKVSNSICVKTL
jgi:hypothetical protein